RNLQERQLTRARTMIRDNAIGREEYDQIAAASEKARATVGAQQAARDLAKLNLDYTRVTAPWSGRISRRLVDPGNLVNADNTILTTLVNDAQLYAYFDVDERTYLDLLGTGAAGLKSGSDLANLKFPVLMRLTNEDQFAHKGV